MIMDYVWKPSVWMCIISQKATQRPSIPSTLTTYRAGAAVVSAITSVYSFFHLSFPCTIVSCTLSPKSKTVHERFEELDHDQDGRE